MKMKFRFAIICLISVFLIPNSQTKAQEFKSLMAPSKDNLFNEETAPALGGLEMFIMRQSLGSLSQTIVRVDRSMNDYADSKLNTCRIETWFPIIEKPRFSSVVGARYWRNQIVGASEDNTDMNFQQMLFFNATRYDLSEKSFLLLDTEYHIRGTNETLFEEVGNEFFSIGVYGHAFNKKWHLYCLAGPQLLSKEDETEVKPMAGAQLKWLPNKKLTLTTGTIVVLGAEWEMNDSWRFAGYFTIDKQISSSLRYRAKSGTSLSLVYINRHNKLNKTYMRTANREFNGSIEKYNRLSQRQNRLFLEYAIATKKKTALVLYSGVSFKEDIDFHNNKDRVGSMNGKFEIFFGLGINFFDMRN